MKPLLEKRNLANKITGIIVLFAVASCSLQNFVWGAIGDDTF